MGEINPAAKARTIAHMNKDHRTDLAHILQHYNKLSATEAADPEMVDIDLESMTVLTDGGKTTRIVHFEPPMGSFDERRTKLIEMTMKAREALGVVPEDDGHGHGHGTASGKVVVAEWHPPQSLLEWAVVVGVLLYFVSFATVRAGWFDRGTQGWRYLELSPFPGGAKGFRWLVEAMFWPVVGIHAGEMVLFDIKKTAKYGLKRGSAVWFLWMVNVFVEGVGAFKRFNRVVGRLGKKSE
ncbi:hypothetical protein OQA88_12069 [Cercophora sp. LCS_1]